MDEKGVSFQMFLILFFYYTWFRKPNFCVQAMSKQYSNVLGGGGCLGGDEHIEKQKFGDEKKTS